MPFCDRRRAAQAARRLHPPALHAPGRRPADPRVAPDPRAAAEAGPAQGDHRRRRRRGRGRRHALRRDEQVPQGVRQALRQHDQRRRGGRRARPDPRPPRRLHGEGRQAEEEGHRRDDLPGGRHLDRRRHRLDDHDLRDPQVRGDLQRLQARPARPRPSSCSPSAAGSPPDYGWAYIIAVPVRDRRA